SPRRRMRDNVPRKARSYPQRNQKIGTRKERVGGFSAHPRPPWQAQLRLEAHHGRGTPRVEQRRNSPNQRVEPMTRSAVTLLFQSAATGALLLMPHPCRSTTKP